MFHKLLFKGEILILMTILGLLNSPDSISQNLADRVDLTLGINAWDPVHIKVEERTGSAISNPIRFTALNSTYYPFDLVIDFIQFENLSPRPPVRVITVSHGSNNIFTFSIHVPGVGYGYKYSYSYWLTSSDEIINKEFPYLIPLLVGKNVNSKKSFLGRVSDSFVGEKGDTVYCMRRGLVTAAPRSETMEFRLSRHDCLEVLQNDGTYMIYHNLNKSEAFTAPGKIVLPGQPIGTLSDSSYLMVTLLKVDKVKNVMITQPIRYTIGKAGTVNFNELDGIEKSIHPWEVITKEMKSRELKEAERKR
jgi:hypothetical protein